MAEDLKACTIKIKNETHNLFFILKENKRIEKPICETEEKAMIFLDQLHKDKFLQPILFLLI